MPRPAPARLAWAGIVSGIALLLAGCGEEATKPASQGSPPDTKITFAPVQYDTVSFRVHLYWSGSDEDGEVVAFRWIVDPEEAARNLPGRWRRTTAHDTTLAFNVDPVSLSRQHVFMVAAEDNDGNVDPTPAARVFSATTRPPTSRIVSGPAGNGGTVGPRFAFEVRGTDPDGGLTVGPAAVDSFQYLLLKLGSVAEMSPTPAPWHLPLPEAYDAVFFRDLVSRADAESLPYPHGDWKWRGIRGTTIRFADMAPGGYVFVVRAVDQAGAVEQGIVSTMTAMRDHLRYVVVPWPPITPPYPQLSISGSGLLRELPPAVGPADFPREPIEIFEGTSLSLSWSGDPSAYGGTIAGYDVALDDPATLGDSVDPTLLGITLGADRLAPGSHVLWIYCLDASGGNTLAEIPIVVVHPAFRDPGAAREILFVDDSLAPGNTAGAMGSFPSDATETAWYLAGDPSHPEASRLPRILDAFPGLTVTEWDTWQKGYYGFEGRKPPGLRDLAAVSTVIWVSDMNNSTTTPGALWETLVGGVQSALGDYLRAGGTLILTGYNLVNNSTNPTTMLVNRTGGLCASFEPGSREWTYSWFPRLFLGVDWVTASEDARRVLGARDFVAAYPTPEAAAYGFDTAFVDTGATGTGAKWNTHSDLTGTTQYLDFNLTPGLPRIEGWHLQEERGTFDCVHPGSFGREAPGQPIAMPVYRYHGVNTGVYGDGGPSPREGRVVGVLCQSHDLGPEENSYGTYNSAHAVGRMVALDIPLYFLHDQQASDVLFGAFSYVNASPTLP